MFVLFCWVQPLEAQYIVFNQAFHTSQFEDIAGVVPAEDDHAIIFGGINFSEPNQYIGLVIKVDAQGQQVWGRTYGTTGALRDGVATVGGKTLLVGEYTNTGTGDTGGLLLCINEVGIEQWRRTFGESPGAGFRGIAKTPNGDFILVGSTQRTGGGDQDILVVKVDPSGNELWSRTYGSAEDEVASFVTVAPSGSIIVLSGNSIYKMDAAGNELWSRSASSSLHAVAVGADGGYAVATGDGAAWGLKPLVMAWGPDGTLRWQRAFSPYSNLTDIRRGRAESIIATSDGHYLVGGNATYPGDRLFVPHSSFAMKISTGGDDVKWSKTFDIESGDGVWIPIKDIVESPAGVYTMVAREWYDLDIRVVRVSDSPLYPKVNGPFIGLSQSDAEWADYDNDGDLDVLTSGLSASGLLTRLYRNNGNGSFSVGADFLGLKESDLEWADYDLDGDMDFVLCGRVGANAYTYLYRNEGAAFTQLDLGLPGVSNGSVDWGDYNNDGRPDLLITGSGQAKIYRNVGTGTFVESGIVLPDLYKSDGLFFDYDGDRRLDVVLIGATSALLDARIAKLYLNDGSGNFTEESSFNGVGVADGAITPRQSSLLITGETDALEPLAYLRNSNIYSGANRPLDFQEVRVSSAQSAGPNLVLSGYNGENYITHVLGELEPSTAGRRVGYETDLTRTSLDGIGTGAVRWADYDQDGDLDPFELGYGAAGFKGQLYENVYGIDIDDLPSTPTNLQAIVSGRSVTLSWSGSPCTSFNVRVGTNPGGIDIVSPSAHTDGTLKTVEPGNARCSSFILDNLNPGIYYWSVQQVSHSYHGSGFAQEGTFTIPIGEGPTLNLHTWLAGPYQNGQMFSSLNTEGLLPLSQPYTSAPWHYAGTEAVPAGFFDENPEIVDWVLVSMRQYESIPESVVGRRAAFIRADGTIVDLDGYSPVVFPETNPGLYFAVIQHRNHLGVMSTSQLNVHTETDWYSFAQPGRVFGTSAMQELVPGIYGLWGGDGNKDNNVTASDYLNTWLPENGTASSYSDADFDLSGQVTAFDFLTVWLLSNGQSSQVPN